MKDIRLLRAEEIECRVQQVKEKGCVLLLYKDARVDMNLLDETFGPNNWKRTHELIDGQLFCNIDVWDEEKNEWVRKQDVGVESMTEKEKGRASDAFKRAGFNVGIGRELYTAPFIWINLDASEVSSNNGRYQLSYKVKFEVAEIEYDNNRVIKKVVIKDQNGNVRYPSGWTSKPKQSYAREEDLNLSLALQQVKEANTIEELTKVYNDWKAAYGSNSQFMSLLEKKTKQLRMPQNA